MKINKNGYLIEKHNIKDMADKILKLVNNDVLAEEFGSKARKHYRKIFNGINIRKMVKSFQ